MVERTVLDLRTDELGKAVYDLRQHIDIQRIIGLNVDAMKRAGASESLWGYFQQQAKISIAIVTSAIYEKRSKDFVLSSLPAIILDLDDAGFPSSDNQAFEKLVKVHGGKLKKTAKETVRAAYGAICSRHRASLKQLADIRNKRACHLELGWKTDWMPSCDEMEKLWDFANDIYRLLHLEYNDVGASLDVEAGGNGLAQDNEGVGCRRADSQLPRLKRNKSADHFEILPGRLPLPTADPAALGKRAAIPRTSRRGVRRFCEAPR